MAAVCSGAGAATVVAAGTGRAHVCSTYVMLGICHRVSCYSPSSLIVTLPQTDAVQVTATFPLMVFVLLH
jgi:hypothetical protein